MAMLPAILIALVMVAALAIDVGQIMATRGQLQHAADAAALAGAGEFDDILGLNEAEAEAAARANLAKNRVLGRTLQDADIDAKTWNLDMSREFQSGDNPFARLVPAIKVDIALSASQNFGAVPMFFASFFGVDPMSLSASATAIKSPSIAAVGSLIPIAVHECLYDLLWDKVADTPRITTEFDIYSALVADKPNVTNAEVKCLSGQWTSLNLINNSATVVQQLIITGNTSEFYSTDEVYIQPGDKTSVYDDIEAATANGQVIAGYLPVTTGDLTVKGYLNAIKFLPFAISRGEKKDVPGGIPYSYVRGRLLTLEEAEELIPEATVRETQTMAPRLVL